MDPTDLPHIYCEKLLHQKELTHLWPNRILFQSREHQQRICTQVDFLTCFLPKNPFPPVTGSGQLFLGFVTFVTADAHSGATVADFNRVPIWLSESVKLPGLHSDINFYKELTQSKIPQIIGTSRKKSKNP